MQEYWVNVYEYKTVKNIQFYSHCIENEGLSTQYGLQREAARSDAKWIYRIHIKMKPKPVQPEINPNNKIKYKYQKPSNKRTWNIIS